MHGRVVNPDVRRGIGQGDQSVAKVRAELESSLAILDTLPRDEDVPPEFALHVAELHAHLYHLDRWLPRVMGWCCGYKWGTGDAAWSTFSAHVNEDDAKLWLPYWEAEIPQQDGKWTIELRPNRIWEFRRPGFGPPKKVAA